MDIISEIVPAVRQLQAHDEEERSRSELDNKLHGVDNTSENGHQNENEDVLSCEPTTKRQKLDSTEAGIVDGTAGTALPEKIAYLHQFWTMFCPRV